MLATDENRITCIRCPGGFRQPSCSGDCLCLADGAGDDIKVKSAIKGCPKGYFPRPDIIAEARPDPSMSQVLLFLKTAATGKYVSEAERIDREKTCATCDLLRIDPNGNELYCGVCGCNVSNSSYQIRNLAAYEEVKDEAGNVVVGCKHPHRGEPKDDLNPSGPVYGWRRVALPQVPFPGEQLKTQISPNGTRFAFVHVPKAAGCSVCRLFGVRPGHHGIASGDPAELAGAFKFAVVRDPWERLVSAFYYLMAGGARTRADFAARRLILDYAGDFKSFVRALASNPDHFFQAVHFKPQTYWTHVDGKSGLDEGGLCRVETFEENVRSVCARLGVEYQPVHDNPGTHDSAVEEFDRDTAELAGMIYAADVEAFGYKSAFAAPILRVGYRPWTHRNLSTRPVILTASDETFFPGLCALAASIRRLDANVPVVCVDVGMTSAQRREIAGLGVMIAPRPRTPLDALLDMAPAQTRDWYPKSWYFDALGAYRRAMWLDADCLVLRDLDKLLSLVDEGPLFTRNHGGDAAGCGNLAPLYELYPVPGPIYDGGINAGVIGMDLDRDARLVRQWRKMCLLAVADHGHDGIGQMARWGDQGALLWAIHKVGLASKIKDDIMRWNYTPNRIGNAKAYRRYGSPEMIEAISRDYPSPAVIHFAGLPKPWLEEQEQLAG
jgi:hypothetical protein